MVIGSCGYGATGSSVLTDLLREYNEIQVFDNFEFVLAYRVDGLQDLEYHLMKQYSKTSSGDYAIKRFLDMSRCYYTPFINKPTTGRVFHELSKKFISEIEQLSYPAIETVDVLTGNVFKNIFAFFSKKIGLKYLEKLFKRRLYWWPGRTIHFSIKPSNFYESARSYTKSIMRAMGADLAKPICLDQPFEGNNPEQSFPFFEDPYAIVIDRDPRDLYIEYKFTTDPNAKFFPHSNVEDFIVYYKNLRKSESSNERILRVKFEDFIYEYDATVKKIEAFLSLSNHKNPKKWFNPSRSIGNTQLIRKHPECIVEIKKIEEDLKEYLYPFEKYKEFNTNVPSFYGAARKSVNGN